MNSNPGVRARGLALGAFALILGACATPRSYIVLLDSPHSDRPSKVTVTNAKGTRTLDKPGEYAGLEEGPETAPRSASDAMIARDFADVLNAEPAAPRRFLLYFLSGTADLTAASADSLTRILAEARARSVPEITIIGHTDTAGSSASNAELASQRARAVRDLVRAAGVDTASIEIASFGEHRPLVATADNVDEPRNRRVEVLIR